MLPALRALFLAAVLLGAASGRSEDFGGAMSAPGGSAASVLGDHALAGVKGLVAVNIAAGESNLQANSAAIALGSSAFAPTRPTPASRFPSGCPPEAASGPGSIGLSVLKRADPAIVYGNIGFIHNFKRKFDDISSELGVVTPGEVDLRNAVTWGLGAAFALNEQMSMSFGFSQLVSQAARTRADGGSWSKLVGSDANAIAFNVGVTYSLSSQMVLVTNFGIGLTPDAPDFAMSIRLPYTF